MTSGGLRLTTVQTERIRMADWSGFTDFGGEADVYVPTNEAEIIALVRDCSEQGKKLRVVGLRTSWNCWWHSTDVMMSTHRLNAIIHIDPQNHTVTCQPGVELADLHAALWEQGLVLETAPAPDWVTVAGCICTGSHGSGPPSMSSSVIGCRLVTATGEVLELDESDERLDAARLSAGMLGVFSSITLRVTDAFYVRQTHSRLNVHDWKRFLTEGEMSYLLWFAHTEHCVLARVDVIPKPESSAQGGDSPSLDAWSETLERFSAFPKVMARINELANNIPEIFPARNRFFMDVFFPNSQVEGPAHKVLMSFKAPGFIAGSEWSVPVTRFDAALQELKTETETGGLFLPGPVWLKKVKAETAWLRASDEDCVQCGIYHSLTPPAPAHSKEMVSRVERIMLRHGGRPHLGKLIYLDPAALRSAYPNWGKFNELRRSMDPQGMFWSKELQERFGE